jgi:hypothetical protein
MPYAENVGLASFLQEYSKSLLSEYERRRQQQDEINKMSAERTMRGVDAGNIMIQDPGLSGFITPSGETLSGNDKYAVQSQIQTTPLQEAPKPRPLSIQEQIELASARRQGKQPSFEANLKTIPTEVPTGTPSETIIDEAGNRKRVWKDKSLTQYQKERLDIERKRAANLRSTGGDRYMRAFAQAANELKISPETLDWPQDDITKWINDRVEEIMGVKSKSRAPIEKPVPVVPVIKKDVPPFQGSTVGETAKKGNITYTWDGQQWQ